MKTLNQREAVYVTTMNVLADAGVGFDDGQTPTAQELVTKEQRAAIIGILVAGFGSREIEMSADGHAKHDTPAKLKTYTSGLVSNWFRKDPRLNGGGKYEAKNPGSRAGAGDEQIKALKTLRAVKADDAEAVTAIDAAIEARKVELGTAKAKSVTLTEEMIAALPEELRSKLGI